MRNAFDAANPFTRASGKGLDPGNYDFFGPFEMATSVRRVPFGAQNRFSGPNPLPSNGFALIKSITYRAVLSEVHR
jgi:hypothetical protein